MKKHLFLRGLALFLCLSLVMGFVPGGIFANPQKVNAVSDEMVEADLNGSFETLDAEGKPANWKAAIGADGVLAISTDDVAEGKNAVHITAAAKPVYLMSAMIPTKEGDTYELTFKAKVLSGGKGLYAGLWFSAGNEYKVVDGNAAVAKNFTATEWQEYTLTFNYYPGAVNLWIEIGNNSGSNSEYLVDDVVLKINGVAVTTGLVQAPEEEEPETPSEVDLDLNWSFELVGEDGLPTAWSLSGAAENGGYSVNTTDAADGSNSLQVDAVAAAKTMQSYAIPVANAGDQYEATFKVKRLSGASTIYMGIWFGAEPHKNYDNYCCNAVNAAADNEWHEYTVSWGVYKDASYMWLEIGNYSGSTVSYLVDDIVLKINGEVVKTIKVSASDAPEQPEATEPVVTEPTKPAAPDVTGYKEVVNEQFDIEDGAEGFDAHGWTAGDGNFNPKNHWVGIYAGYYKGTASVFLQKAVEEVPQNWIQSPAFEVKAGLNVVALANIISVTKVEGSADMILTFVDADGNALETVTKAVGTAEDWAEDFIAAVAPKGAVAAYLKFQKTTGDTGIDNVRIYAEQPAPAPDVSGWDLYINEQFDKEELDPEFDPNFWTASEEWDTADAKKHSVGIYGGYYNGTASMFLQNWKGAADSWVKSPAIPVKAGVKIAAFANILSVSKVDDSANMIISFIDATGKAKGEFVKAIGSADEWAEEFFSVVAPAGAVYAYVTIQRTNGDTGIDNVRVYIDKDVSDLEVVIPNAPATDFKAPAIESFPSAHPYVYFTPEELDALRAAYAGEASASVYGFSWKSQVESIISQAEAALNLTQINQGFNAGTSVLFEVYPVLIDPNDPYYDQLYLEASIIDGKLVEYPHLGFGCLIPDTLRPYMESLALAYAITGEEKYAERAIFFADSMANWEWWGDYYWLTTYSPSSKADASVAWTMQGVTVVYDLCYDAMTDAQRENIETAIFEKGITFLAAGYNKTSTANGNMMLLGGLLSGLAAIISEDNYDELKPYIDIAVEGVKLSFDNYYYSGNTEGHYYTSFGLDYFMPGVSDFYRATGMKDLGEHPFLTEMLPYWCVYWAAPISNLHPYYGDGGGGSYLHTSMACISKMTGNPLANYYLVSTGGTKSIFQNLVYLNPNPEIEEPTAGTAFVPQIGFGALRTGFANDDMLLSLFSNQSKMGHNHYDQNTFQLAVNGAWVITDRSAAAYYSDNRDYISAIGHNTILVDGKDQSVKSTGAMEKIFGSSLYGYLVGSAPAAYGAGTLDKFDRHAIMLNHAEKPYYIIIDDLASAEEHTFSWQMYTGGTTGLAVDGEILPENVTVTGNDVSITVGVNKLNVSFVAEDGVDMSKALYYVDGTLQCDTFIASSAATKAQQFMSIISTENVLGRDYINFGGMSGGSYSQTEVELENGVAYKTSNTSGRVILKPNSIGTIATLFFRGGGVGDWIKLPFEVKETGVYDLSFLMGVSDGCCTTKLIVDGKYESDPYDLSGLPESSYSYEFKNIELEAGTHYVTCEVVDIGYSPNYAGPTWFLINAGGLVMDRVDINTEEVAVAEKVTVAETYDDENVLGAKINYSGDLCDIVMFNRTDALVSAGLLSTDAKQASVLGLSGNVITEGFAATDATTLVYDGLTLFEAEKALNIVRDATGWTITSAEAQTVKLAVEDGVITVEVEAGENFVEFVEDENPDEPSVPTGDNTAIIAMTALAVLVMAGAAVIISKRKYF